MRELKIGTSWVRGAVGDALTPELIVHFSSAFGTWVRGGPVVIGHDPRRSSAMLRAAVVAGLASCDCEVIDMGVSTTPLVSFAVREIGAAGGLSITGSHNGPRWNALKFISPDGTLLNAVKSEELLDIFHARAYDTRACSRALPTAPPEGVAERYLEHLASGLDVEAIRARGFRVAVDFCNGSCGPAMAAALEHLGCTLFPLNEEASPEFAHLPAPTAANMRELIGLMRHLDVDVGAAVNVDGDRVAFVGSDSEPLSEEYTLPLAACSRLARRPGPIVTNLSTSMMIDSVAARHDQTVLRTTVGEGHVMDRGIQEACALAGEGSGGVGALPYTATFDATLTMGLVLESLVYSDKTLGELVDTLPHPVIHKGEIPCSPDQVYRVLQKFRTAYADGRMNVTDGVRVEWDDAWLHVRSSMTEPLLRIIVEAETGERAETLFEEAMETGQEAVQGTREI